MDAFKIELAGIPMEIKSRYVSYCRRFFRNYLTDHVPAFSVSASEDILVSLKNRAPGVCREALERDGIYYAIASELPFYNCVCLHGACITYKGKGILFTGASGLGKSTHIGLWKQYVGADVDIVNGDKPIFCIEEGKSGLEGQREIERKTGTEGRNREIRITAYDTPWCGKEGWNGRCGAPISEICFLRRSTDGAYRIRRVDSEEAASLMLRQMFCPKKAEAAGRTLEMLDQIIGTLPLYILECNISEDAVRCSFEALTGEEYVSRGILYSPDEVNRLWRLPG